MSQYELFEGKLSWTVFGVFEGSLTGFVRASSRKTPRRFYAGSGSGQGSWWFDAVPQLCLGDSAAGPWESPPEGDREAASCRWRPNGPPSMWRPMATIDHDIIESWGCLQHHRGPHRLLCATPPPILGQSRPCQEYALWCRHGAYPRSRLRGPRPPLAPITVSPAWRMLSPTHLAPRNPPLAHPGPLSHSHSRSRLGWIAQPPSDHHAAAMRSWTSVSHQLPLD
jgi:hypothetical protein